MPALRHRPDARLHGRPGLHLQADQDAGGADLEEAMTARRRARGRSCLVGTGNPWRHDDGVGPWLAEASPVPASRSGTPRTCSRTTSSTSPGRPAATSSSWTPSPRTSSPGRSSSAPRRLGEPAGPSTHKLALGLCGKILEAHGKRTFLLGIVPRDLDFGLGLTPDVAKAPPGPGSHPPGASRIPGVCS